MSRFVFLLALAAFPAPEATNPIAKVLQLMDDLAGKITADGEAADAAYKEYFEWCDDTTKNQDFEIKDGNAKKEKLEAKIEELGDEMEAAGPKIDELAAAISEAEAELAKATKLRKKEEEVFMKSEAELVEGVDMLSRAIDIISREMEKNPAAFAQTSQSARVTGIISTLGTVLEAASFSTNDRQKLVALVQSQQKDEDEDDQAGAPAAAAYKSKSGGIVDTLEEMNEKAEGELDELRKAEGTSKHNFKMLSQALKDETAANNKDLAEQKQIKASASEGQAAAKKDLEVTLATLKSTQEAQETTRSECISVAADHENSIKSRTEELTVIAKAKSILQEATEGSFAQTYSMLQVSSSSSAKVIAEVSATVKRLAGEDHSASLAQLASKIGAAASYSSDPFVKVRGLIQDMIAKLQAEAEADANEKAFCDEEMAKTEAKKGDLDGDKDKLTAKIDQSTSAASDARRAVKALESELGALAKAQAELDKIRGEQHADYKVARADLEKGLAGVQKAIRVLRDYYESKDEDSALLQEGAGQPAKPVSHSKSSGGAGGILDILDVAESDMAKNLADIEAEESEEQADYEKVTQENKISKAEKEQAVKYKKQEAKTLETNIAEMSNDLTAVNEELKSVNEYYKKIQERCVAKPESYEERAKRRANEIKGLKQALEILESEAALVQRGHRGLRRRQGA